MEVVVDDDHGVDKDGRDCDDEDNDDKKEDKEIHAGRRMTPILM